MRAGALCCTRAVLLALALGAVAHAQEPAAAAMSLAVDGCATLDTAEVERLLAVELSTRAANGGSGARVAVRCEGLRVSVASLPSPAAKPLTLELDLSETGPEARARVLALAIAELLATERLEAGPPPSAASEPAEHSTRAHLSSVWLAAGAARQLQPAAIGPAFALGIEGRAGAWSLEADLALALASLQLTAAEVHARELSLSLAPGLHVASEQLDFGVALGLRAGFARLSATALQPGQRGTSLSGLVLMPLARALLGIRLTSALSARLAIEADYSVKPLRGLDSEGKTLAAERGFRLSALLGLALQLSNP